MAEFAYNNTKNASTGHIPFELNYGYHPWISYKKDVDSHSKSKSADKLLAKLRNLMIFCRENLHHTQELQKQANDKGVKPQNYASVNKVWLNSKYIKSKQNQKLEAKFFGPFRVLHPIEKQAYKLELPRKQKIHNIFYVSLLEQDTTKKGRVDKNKVAKLDAGDDESREYEVKAISDSAVYAKKSASYSPELYYLMSWKDYLEEENIWKPYSAVQHLRKLSNSFHKNYPDKLTANSEAIDIAPPMARPTVRPTTTATAPLKQKQRYPANSPNKQTKKS